ncbi:MAG: molybdenum cofactor guanylyltransferase MobA [Gammaproteobacteria bacterium]|jgi:molybdopterin-guanine dinucleotide biosynthesis protein A
MTEQPIPPQPGQVTAVILSGGRSQRMAGEDKGWVELNDEPFIEHTLKRLGRQTDNIMISANRSLDRYQQLGIKVVTDQHSDFPGPLAGMYAALTEMETDWLLTVPCDTPLFPNDLLQRFISELSENPNRIAVASDGKYLQPVFCLIHRSLADNLKNFLDSDGHKTGLWIRQQKPLEVVFADGDRQFININTLAELQDFIASQDNSHE